MDKVLFNPGATVTLKQDIDNKPTMVVDSVDKSSVDGSIKLLGITCMWFNTKMELQKKRFSSKDLELIKDVY